MSIFESVTNSILTALETIDINDCYKLPWHTVTGSSFPKNVSTNKPYRGINILALLVAANSRGYDYNLWGTFKQWQELGATVKKGEKSVRVVLWKPSKKEEGEAQEKAEKRVFFANSYNVFNVSQVQGYELPVIQVTTKNERIKRAEDFFSQSGAKITTGGEVAYYSPTGDYIKMPAIEVFNDSISYYSVLAHETTHWTGAKTRLNRELENRFGSESYAAEELIAELGAAFLCAELGLSNEPRADHAKYIASWITVLKKDPKAIFTAASKAQEATDYLKVFQNKDIQEAA